MQYTPPPPPLPHHPSNFLFPASGMSSFVLFSTTKQWTMTKQQTIARLIPMNGSIVYAWRGHKTRFSIKQTKQRDIQYMCLCDRDDIEWALVAYTDGYATWWWSLSGLTTYGFNHIYVFSSVSYVHFHSLHQVCVCAHMKWKDVNKRKHKIMYMCSMLMGGNGEDASNEIDSNLLYLWSMTRIANEYNNIQEYIGGWTRSTS